MHKITLLRLNGVVSLVTVFEELSHVSNLFWSRDKVNRGISLFDEQNLRRADVVVSLLNSEHMLPPSVNVQTWEEQAVSIFLQYELVFMFFKYIKTL